MLPPNPLESTHCLAYNYETMILLLRRFLAIVSACAFVAGAAIYVLSYAGATMEGIFPWAILLHIGIFLLFVPMFFLEYPASQRRTFWKAFAQGRPRWVVPIIAILGLFYGFHFILLLVQGHMASPAIQGGHYVLSDHGRIVKLLTQAEYFRLKGAELRMFSTLWMCFYFILAMYWWFPRVRHLVV